jgi:hypothetical protein
MAAMAWMNSRFPAFSPAKSDAVIYLSESSRPKTPMSTVYLRVSSKPG